LRGGSWNNNQNNARAAYRNNNNPDNRNNNIGFRVLVRVRPTPYLFLRKKGVPLFGCSRTLPLKRVCAGLGTRRRLYHKPLLPVYACRQHTIGICLQDAVRKDEMAQVFLLARTAPSVHRVSGIGASLVTGIYKIWTRLGFAPAVSAPFHDS